MRNVLEEQYQIDLYLNGLLNEEETLAFESKIANDAEWANKVLLTQEANDAVFDAWSYSFRNQIKSDIKKFDRIKRLKKIAFISIAALIILSIAFYFRKKSGEQVIEKPRAIQEVTLPKQVVSTFEDLKVENELGNKSLGKSDKQVVSKKELVRNKESVSQENKSVTFVDNVHEPLKLVVENPKFAETKNMVLLDKKVDPVSVKEVKPLHPQKLNVEDIPEKHEKITEPRLEVSINPDLGEYWNIPNPNNEHFTYKILDKAGTVVFQGEGKSDQVMWEGNRQGGELLNMGIYYFYVEYSSGKKILGDITILR